MQQLGINTIRVYNVNPTTNHDLCASIFNEVGIYMLIDVNSPLPEQSIDRSAPQNSYNDIYLLHVFSVVQAFMGYDNVLGFFAGNEVMNDAKSGAIDPPYVRVRIRHIA
jgi:hypothetical protein